MAANVHLTSAVILRATDFRDTSKILSLLTEDLGRVDVIAKGARNNLKQFRGGLGPFTVVEAQIRETRSELWQLQNTKVQALYSNILAHYSKLKVGSLAIEWIRKTLRELKPDPQFFEKVKSFFDVLDSVNEDAVAFCSAAFSLQWMQALGFSPEVKQCGHCGKQAPTEKSAYFDIEHGALCCSDCKDKTKLHPKYVYLLSAKTRKWIQKCCAEPLTELFEKSEEVSMSEKDFLAFKPMLTKFVSFHTHVDLNIIQGLLLEKVAI